jgi:peptide/nickel transport system substrate-binding protein
LGLTVPAISALLARPASSAPGPSASRRARLQSDPSTLIIADNLSGFWITLDPAIIYEINSQAAFNVVYEPLYHLPDSTQAEAFEPLLAEGLPEISADGLTATIRLRQGVVFHTTGNPMTAADWIFSWNRLKGQAGNPSFLAEYLGVYEAVDDFTLQLTLSTPNAALVAILSSAPLSVTDSVAVAAAGGTDAADSPEPVDVRTTITEGSFGTGPYLITKFDINTEVIVERNPTFWGEPATFDRIIWRNEQDPNTQLQLVQTGEADIAYSVDPDAISTVESDENLQLLSGPTMTTSRFIRRTTRAVRSRTSNSGRPSGTGSTTTGS